MPIYEFRCPKCGKIVELFFTRSLDGVSNITIHCPVCRCDVTPEMVPSVPAPVRWGKGGKPTP